MYHFEKNFTSYLIKSGIVSKEQEELYVFGFHQLQFILLNGLTAIGLSILWGMLGHCLLFMAVYYPLRMYAGGYHAKTQLGCYFFSTGLLVVVLSLIKYFPWSVFIYLLITVASGIFIFCVAPVEHPNKPFEPIERQVYRKRARIMLPVVLVCDFVLWLVGWQTAAICMSMALASLSIILLMGCYANARMRVNKAV